MPPGEDTGRKGQDRAVLGDTSRGGDVTTETNKNEALLLCFLGQKYSRVKIYKRLHLQLIPNNDERGINECIIKSITHVLRMNVNHVIQVKHCNLFFSKTTLTAFITVY